MKAFKQVILIRHAESVANTYPDLICGRAPSTPLSLKGREQAKMASKTFNNLYSLPKFVYCSSALRAQETARLLFGEEMPLISSDQLVEQSAGIYEGSSRKISYTEEILQQMEEKHVHFRPKDGESISDAGKRLLEFIQDQKEEQLVIVSHSMAIKGLLHETVQLRPQSLYLTACENTSITEIQHHPQRGWYLVRCNVVG
jgi:broad specificity phosphatase PhoE